MIDTLDDVEPPYRSGDSDKVERAPKWPSVEEAKRRIENEFTLQDDKDDQLARDLIVLMRELGRVTARLGAADNAGWALKVKFDDLEAENAALKKALRAEKGEFDE